MSPTLTIPKPASGISDVPSTFALTGFATFHIGLPMKPAILLSLLLLAGCNTVGGIPDKTIEAVANAGGGCIFATGVWGQGIVMVAGADKGVLRNGEIQISGNCQGISIKDAATVRASLLPPGTVVTTTTTIPSSTTTTVQPK